MVLDVEFVPLDRVRLVVQFGIVLNELLAELLDGWCRTSGGLLSAGIISLADLGQPILGDLPRLLDVSSPKRPMAGFRRIPELV